MATATAPRTAAEAALRADRVPEADARRLRFTAITTTTERVGEELGIKMSDEWETVQRIVEEWAVRTYGDHVPEATYELQDLTGDVYTFIEEQTLAWAATYAKRDRAEGSAA